MASRFWVGGTGSWDTSDTTHWAATSGGGGGQSVPSSSDTVTFDGSSGTGTVTLTGALNCASFDASAAALPLQFTSTGTISCVGAFTLKTGIVVSGWTGTLTMTGTTANNLTFAGVTMACALTINGTGSWALADNFATASGKALTVTQGTFNANGKNVTCGSLLSTTTNTRTITMGAGTWTLTTNNAIILQTANVAGLTFTQGNPFVLNYSGATGTRTISSAQTAGTFPSFNITAGTDTVSVAGNIGSLNYTGFSGTITGGAASLTGSLTCPNTVTWTASATAITFTSMTSANIDTNGVLIDRPFTFNGVGGSWTLLSDLQLGSTRVWTLSNGGILANNKNVTVGAFSSGVSTTRTLSMGSGTWDLTGTGVAWQAWGIVTTGLTFTASTSTIKISGSTVNVRTFFGGGATYNNLWITNATSGGEVDFAGDNTFNDFKQQDATPQTIKFTASTTTTVSSWSAFGTAGNLLTIGSVTAAQHTLKRVPPATGNIFVCVDYMSISQSAISTTSPMFYAGKNSTNGGTNNWTFWTCPTIGLIPMFS